MSKTIDEKVVSMKFDNAHFEKNVQTSMSTLDKLKHSLNFDGATKGFANISSAAGKCDLSPIGAGVETVKAKFSALEVMAVTALANITNSAVNAGKNLIKAFTITPITTGFNEYELKMGAIQTIMAGTGESLATVNGYLDELNAYSDKTIYSFADMTQNIGKFTNAGVNLDDAVLAMKGISNEAALSGANANQAAQAMYNLSQAISMGYVQLIDWKSIENANMATKEFKTQLAGVASQMGTISKVGEDMYQVGGKSYSLQALFKDALKDQWLTTDVLISTLRDYADETTEIGKKAYAAAQDVKTFSMMMDTLKEAAQSGWASTWQLIIGDFEKAKELWTDWSDTFGDMIAASADTRNSVLMGGLSSKWDQMIDKINKAGASSKDFETSLRATLEKHGYVVDDVIEEYGTLEKAFHSGKISSNLLKEAIANLGKSFSDLDEIQSGLDFGKTGDDVKAAQKALKQLGYDLGEFGEQADGLDGIFGKVTKSAVEAFQSANNLKVTGIVDDATLAKLKEATGTTEEFSVNCDNLIDSITELGGRENLVIAIDNAFQGLKKTLETIKTAWNNIFYPDKNPDEIIASRAQKILKLTEAIKKFSEKLVISDENAGKLRRTFEGLFAIFRLVWDITGGLLNKAFTILSSILSGLDINILDVTAVVGDAAKAFYKWFSEANILAKSIEYVAKVCKQAYEFVAKFVKAFLEIPAVSDAITKFKEDFGGVLDSLKEYFGVGNVKLKEFTERFQKLDKLNLTNISTMLKDFKTNVLDYFLKIDFSGITGSFETLRQNLGKSLNGLGINFDSIIEKFKTFVEYVRSKIPAAIAIGLGALLIKGISDIADVISVLLKPLEGVASMLINLSVAIKKVGNSISRYFKAKAFQAITAGIKDLAISILIIAGAIAILTKLDQGKMWAAVGAIAAISGVLIGLSFALSKISAKDTLKIGTLGLTILAIGAAMLLLTRVVKIISGMSPEDLLKGVVVVTALGLLVGGLIAVSKYAGEYATQSGTMILKIGVALLAIVVVMKICAGMDAEDIIKGTFAVAAMEGLVAGLMLISRLAGENVGGIGSSIFKIGLALLAMVAVVKIAAGLSEEEISKGLKTIAGLELLVSGMIIVSNLAGQYSSKAGAMVLQIGIGLVALIGAMKLAASLSREEIVKGLATVGALELFAAGLIAVSKYAGPEAAKAGAMILMLSGSLMIMTGSIHLLKDIEPRDLMKAVAAIEIMGQMFAALIFVTQFAQSCKSTLIVLTVAVGILAGSIALLSRIDTKSLATAAASLAGVMLSFGAIIAASSLIKPTAVTKALITVGAISLLVALLAHVIKQILECGDAKSTLEIAGSISLLLVVMSGALSILSKMKVTIDDALEGVAALLTMCIPLAALVIVLAMMQGVRNAEKNAIILTAMMTALTLLLIPVTLCGLLISVTKGMALLGVAGLLGMIIPMAGLVGILAMMQGIQNAEKNAKLLTDLMTVMGDVLFKISLVGPLALIADAALLGMIGIMATLGAFAVAVGALMEKFPKLQEFLDKGIPVLEQLAKAVGSMIGNFIAGFSEAIMDILPHFGECLSQFMENIQGFTEGAKGIDESVLKGIARLSAAILALSAADLLAAISSFLGVGFVELGRQLSGFMTEAQGFIEGAKTISPETASAIDSLSSMILKLTASELIDGITNFLSKITGTSSMSTFAEMLSSFGDSVVAFSESISGLTEEDLTKVDLAAKAGERMANMADTIPKIGGLMQSLAGFSDMADFGTKIEAFGKSLVAYAGSVKNLTEEDAANIQRSADAGMALAKLNDSIPKVKGLAQMIAGFKDMADFGTRIVAFGKCIITYAESVRGLTDEDAECIVRSADAGMALAELNNAIPRVKGLAQAIAGFKDLNTFGSGLAVLGLGIKTYIESVRGIDDSSISSITKSGEAIDAIVVAVEKIPKSGGIGGTVFGERDPLAFGLAASALGRGIKTYIASIQGINEDTITSINTSGSAIEAIKNAVSKAPTNTDKYTNAAMVMGSMLSVVDGIKAYIYKCVGISDGIASIQSSKTAIEEIAVVANELAGLSAENIGLAAVQISQLATTISGLANMDFSGVAAFKTALSELATVSIDEFVNSFTNAIPSAVSAVNTLITAVHSAIISRSGTVGQAFNAMMTKSLSAILSKRNSFAAAGQQIAKSLQNGIISGGSGVITALTSIVEGCASALSTKYIDFYNAGGFLAEGFANGIQLNAYMATEAAAAMAQAVKDKIEEILDINSPSEEMKKDGAFVDEGMALGILEEIPTVQNAADKLAENVLEPVKEIIDSAVPKDSGEAMVDNLAGAITNDTSAEKAATVKAQSVIKSFSDELKKFDLDIATSDLEYKLWSSINGGSAKESEKTAAEVQNLTEKLQYQSEKVRIANLEYNDTVTKAGQASEEAQEAYNRLLQEQIDLADLSQKLTEAQEKTASNMGDAMVNYAKFMAENQQLLLDQGFELEQIEQVARERSGMNNTTSNNMVSGVKNTISNSMASVQSVYEKSAQEATTAMANTFSAAGTNYATAISNAISTYSPKIVEAFKTVLTTCTEAIRAQRTDWIEIGVYLIDGMVQGITDSSINAINAASRMANEVAIAAQLALGVNSPSKVFYGIGSYCGEGLVNALHDYARKAQEAGESVGNASVNGLRDAISGVSTALDSGLETQPTIRPVVDMANINAGSIKMDANIGASLSQPIDSLSQIVSDAQARIDASNAKVVTAIESLKTDINGLSTSIDGKETALYVNSKKLASSLSKDMDHQLNILSKRGAYTR